MVRQNVLMHYDVSDDPVYIERCTAAPTALLKVKSVEDLEELFGQYLYAVFGDVSRSQAARPKEIGAPVSKLILTSSNNNLSFRPL